MTSAPHESEAGLVARVFAPLTRSHPAALGLLDDAAFLPPSPVGTLATVDQVIEGTHFLGSDPLDAVARKLVRRNLSDVIAKGCEPTGAFLSLAWPSNRPKAGIDGFAAALGDDLASRCGNCPLLGGDTSRTDGGLVASLLMLGRPSAGGNRPVTRSTGRAGDALYVTGAIGGAWAGLQARLGRIKPEGLEAAIALSQVPEPPALAMASVVARHANASVDVSDGLLADASALAVASGCGALIEADLVPTMPCALVAARALHGPQGLSHLLTGGDDYQTLCAVPDGARAAFEADAAAAGVAVTSIGVLRSAPGLEVRSRGAVLTISGPLGWQMTEA